MNEPLKPWGDSLPPHESILDELPEEVNAYSIWYEDYVL